MAARDAGAAGAEALAGAAPRPPWVNAKGTAWPHAWASADATESRTSCFWTALNANAFSAGKSTDTPPAAGSNDARVLRNNTP